MRTIPRRTALLAPLAGLLGLSVTDFPDWQAPQAHASAIAVTGVPLLHAKNLLESVSQVSVAAGTLRNGKSTAVTQPSYLVRVGLNIGGAATIPFAEVQLSWVDSASGLQVGTDSFIVPCASTPSPFAVYGTGSVKADTVTCNVRNLDSSVALTVSYTTWQTSRVVLRDRWHWVNALAAGSIVPGFTLPNLPDDESVLGLLDGVMIAASTQNVYLFGMHDGLVNVGYEVNTGSASNLSIRIRPKPDSSYSGHNIIYSATQPPANFQVAGPRAPLGVVVANAATTNMVLSLSAIRAD